MTLRNFSLRPFPGERREAGVTIAGAIERTAGALSVRCTLRRSDPSGIDIPDAREPPARRDRLWEHSCLELFLGEKGSSGYWEFNLSPAGHWNVYSFTGCREGMREEPIFDSLPFDVRIEPANVRFTLKTDIARIIPAQKAMEAGVAFILKASDGSASHWAPVHRGPRPDFHRRDGFTLLFPGSIGDDGGML
jgi:hypothetical protein